MTRDFHVLAEAAEGLAIAQATIGALLPEWQQAVIDECVTLGEEFDFRALWAAQKMVGSPAMGEKYAARVPAGVCVVQWPR
jgi:hypothetical protein